MTFPTKLSCFPIYTLIGFRCFFSPSSLRVTIDNNDVWSDDTMYYDNYCVYGDARRLINVRFRLWRISFSESRRTVSRWRFSFLHRLKSQRRSVKWPFQSHTYDSAVRWSDSQSRHSRWVVRTNPRVDSSKWINLEVVDRKLLIGYFSFFFFSFLGSFSTRATWNVRRPCKKSGEERFRKFNVYIKNSVWF